MADGEWRITQYAPAAKAGVKVTVVTIRNANSLSLHDPKDERSSDGLVFTHKDGRQEIYPWASIVKAEYTPPTP